MNPNYDNILALALEDLACYAIALYRGFDLARHIQAVIEKLEAVERGLIRRLMNFMPPRHGKSLAISQLFPGWYLGRHPDRSVIFVTYSQELADDFGWKVRNEVSDPTHQAIFPACRLAAGASSIRHFETTAGGSYYAVGRGGPITGRGAHLLIIDDPIKASDEARSEACRRATYEWFLSVAYTRLQPGGVIVIVQTRWHEDDLAGRLLREHPEEGWEVLSFPAIAERDEGFRRAGEPLWPDRFPLAELEQIRLAVGSTTWASLYQQHPSPVTGGIFRRGDWQHYQQVPERFDEVLQSWDCSFKDTDGSDYVVGQVWGFKGPDKYLLDQIRERLSFTATLKAIRILSLKWPQATTKLVEDKANGSAVIDQLRHVPGLIAVEPEGGKEARAHAVSAFVEGHNVYLPQGASWVGDFIEECAAFPHGAHDDQVDAMTQALTWNGRHSHGLLELWRQQAEQIKTGGGNELAAAQMNSLNRGIFGADRRTPVPQVSKPRPPFVVTKCEQCGNPNLWRGTEFVKCYPCGWIKQRPE